MEWAGIIKILCAVAFGIVFPFVFWLIGSWAERMERKIKKINQEKNEIIIHMGHNYGEPFTEEDYKQYIKECDEEWKETVEMERYLGINTRTDMFGNPY